MDRGRAFEAYLAGVPTEAIAELVSAPLEETQRVIEDAMSARAATRERVVAVELARLDAVLKSVWADARRGDQSAIEVVLKINQRRIATLGALPDAGLAETGVTRLDEVAQRRAARGGAAGAGGAKVAPQRRA